MPAGALPAPQTPETTAMEFTPQAVFPTEPSPPGGPAPRLKRAYKRRKKFRFTKARRAAARANLAKALDTLRAQGWPHSELQRAAASANVEKAQAAIREDGLPSTEARRAAALANLAKANAVLRDQGYPRSERQREASRRNLVKAWEVSHDPANYSRIYDSRLKHGFYARRLNQLVMQYLDSLEEARVKRRRSRGRTAKRKA